MCRVAGYSMPGRRRGGAAAWRAEVGRGGCWRRVRAVKPMSVSVPQWVRAWLFVFDRGRYGIYSRTPYDDDDDDDDEEKDTYS